jgi:eukaryotic-like serine/threonine-protein kinase
MREENRVERKVFADELKRLRQIAEQVPQIDRVLYGGVRDAVAWVASPFHANAIQLKQATRGAALGLTAMKIAIELGEHVARGNKLGWLHGSMNPEHVLITEGGGYVITHFGFVRPFEPGEEETGREPRYAAPELLFGKRPINKRTDVYGLGTVLYELLCRRELYCCLVVELKAVARITDVHVAQALSPPAAVISRRQRSPASTRRARRAASAWSRNTAIFFGRCWVLG